MKKNKKPLPKPDYRAPVYKDLRKHQFKCQGIDRRRAIEIMSNATCGD
jgi:hypothetical protein